MECPRRRQEPSASYLAAESLPRLLQPRKDLCSVIGITLTTSSSPTRNLTARRRWKNRALEREVASPRIRRALASPRFWLIFAAGNRSESNFHYLGTQKVEGHATYVITFAQVPVQVRKPSLLATATDTIPLLYQGVAWIDAHDFQILRLRTDLLAPLPQLGLDRVTSTIEYAQVHIPDLADPLWLPQEVELLWQTNGQEDGEIHRYSRYQLFRATIKLRP